MAKAAIVGGSGYTGGELARLLCRHPRITLEAITSRQLAGTKVAKTHGNLEGFVDLDFVESLPEGEKFDIAFVATPHGASMDIVPRLLKTKTKIIDLSGDYRLRDSETYKQWYGLEHRDPGNLGKAAYGIPELFGKEIAKARLVANPGCYPTCASLGLAPLFANGLVEHTAIVDAKSGTSGAGQELTKMTHHPTCGASLIPYKVSCHRHTPEIQMVLERLASSSVEVVFTPHLMPIVRGMLCTIYVRLKKETSKEQLVAAYSKFYGEDGFVRIVQSPSIPSVVGSNYCEVGLEKACGRNLVVISVLDNLVKGGSGQAVQNANLMLGLPQKTGLDFPGLGV
ncbi:MAG: N-acetyl-gamma-glutamyl-phosphate reductase [Methanomassiliicoccales archaeon]|jgi:N-acetyl-gamma-glutamyl-phosphate reductase